MTKLIELRQEEVDRILEKIRIAQDDLRELSLRRQKCFDAYARRPLGNEIENRSQYIAGDVLTQIEVTYPQVMKQSLSTSQKTTFLGPDPMIAKALKVKCQQIIRDQGAFRLYANVIKSGLISITGTVKVWWSRTYKKRTERHEMVPGERLEQLKAAQEAGVVQAMLVEDVAPAEGAVIMGHEMAATMQHPSLHNVTVTYLGIDKSGPVIAYVPPEEFIVERGKSDINDRKGCGLVRKMNVGELRRMQAHLSMPGAPFFRNMQQAIDNCGKPIPEDLGRTEREGREALHFSTGSPADDNNPSGEIARKEGQAIEWIDYVIDAAGREVWAKLWLFGTVCIRAEENEESIVNYPTWTPIPIPGALHGMSAAEHHLHEYLMKSMFGRGVLDATAFAIDREVYATEGADVLGLMNRFPGKVIAGKKGQDFDFGEQPDIGERTYMAIDWLTRESSSIGPGNPLLWGGQVDPREKTATGAHLRQRSSLSRTDLVAMAFTELFIVDLNNKLVYLLQQHLDMPCKVTVDGQEIELTRENIQGPYTCVADFGLDVDFDDAEFSKMMAINQDMMASAQVFPMLYPLKAVYETKKKLLVAAGERLVGEMISPPPPEMEGWFLGQPLPGQEPSPAALLAGGPTPPGMPPAAMPPGMDNASGQGSAQPDTTMMGGPEV